MSSDSDTCNISRGASRHDINLDAPVATARMAERREEEQEPGIDAGQVELQF